MAAFDRLIEWTLPLQPLPDLECFYRMASDYSSFVSTGSDHDSFPDKASCLPPALRELYIKHFFTISFE